MSADLAAQVHQLQTALEEMTRTHAQERQEWERAILLFRATLEALFDGISVIDAHSNVPIFNQRVQEIWSLPEPLLQPERGLERLQFMAEQTVDPQGFIDRVRELVQEQPESAAMDLIQFKDGRLFERYSQALRNGSEIIGRVWTMRDITHRQRMEAALRQQEAQYRTIFEVMGDGLIITDLETGRLVAANPAACQMHGYSYDEFMTLSPHDFVHPHSFQQLQEFFQALRVGGEYACEAVDVRQDGTLFPVEVKGTCCTYNGKTRAMAIVRDISDRKQAEETLRQQQEVLRTVIDTDPSLIFVKDWEGRYLLANKAAAAFYHKTVDEIIGKYDWELHPNPAVVQRFLSENRRVIEAGESLFIEAEKVATATDREEWLQWQKRPLRLPGSETYSVLGIGVNITERKQREESLRLIVEGTAAETGEEFFRAFVQYLAQVLHVRCALVTEFANEAKTRVRTLAVWHGESIAPNFEYNIDGTPCAYPLQGQTFYWPEGVQAEFPQDQDLAEAGLESYLGVPLMNSANEVLGHLAVMDVQPMQDDLKRELILRIFAARAGAELERKRADEALQRRAQVESLLSSISRQFIDQDLPTALTFALRVAAIWIGSDRSCIYEFSPDQQQVQLVHEWYAPGVEPLSSRAQQASIDLMPDFYRQILLGQSIQIRRLEDLPAGAPERMLFSSESIQSVLAVPMIHSGTVLGFIGADVVREIKGWSQEEATLLQLVGELIAIGRARHQAEEALRDAKEAALREAARSAEANRAKSVFLANMSHELRTPLNAILGFTQLMERDSDLSDRQRYSLSIINRSGEHLLNLINDVLEVSKIEAGRIVLSPHPFDLHHLLHTLQDLFQMRAQGRHLSLQVCLDQHLPQFICTDEGKLRQVLINLLGNAIKFTDRGHVILRVQVQPQANSSSALLSCLLRFEVEDTGCGIAPEELNNLFRPFVQTQSGTQVREGTGLGLAISRQYVQLIGGDLTCSSRLGQGSTFQFTVEVALADPTQVSSAPPNQQVLRLAPDQPAYRILVVDDRLENRQLIEQLLGSVGFQVQTAVDGVEAIARWQTWQPHLIWMDMRMPQMDGYAATRKIRELEAQAETLSRTVIIALTASAFEEQQGTILAAGCDDLVRKPFRERLIFEKLTEHLGVTYEFREPEAVVAETEQLENVPVAVVLRAAALQGMPATWVEALYQAAFAVDAEQIRELIAQIPVTEADLARGLMELVEQFEFDAILDLAAASLPQLASAGLPELQRLQTDQSS